MIPRGISYPKVYSLLSGGKDSITTTQLLSEAGKLEACVALETGICTPDWKEWLEALCDERRWQLEFYQTDASYDQEVLKYGFPGPTAHRNIMRRLKGRAVRQFRKYRPSSILASGVRRHESVKRAASVREFSVWEGVPVLAPIFDWTTEETWEFFYDRGFERAPAYSTLQISGDCLCGAYAADGEPEALQFHYPNVGAYLSQLGEQIAKKHPTRCKWGWGSKDPIPEKNETEAFGCVECERPRDLFTEETPHFNRARQNASEYANAK